VTGAVFAWNPDPPGLARGPDIDLPAEELDLPERFELALALKLLELLADLADLDAELFLEPMLDADFYE